jgi:hypothetical protein
MFCWWDHHHFSSAHSAGIILRRRVSFWIPAAGHLAKNDDGRTSKTFLVQNNHKNRGWYIFDTLQEILYSHI